jgi:hypothetical protein
MNEKNLRNANRKDKKIPLISSEFLREKEYPEILTLSCQDQQLTATLSDGRIVSIPIVWFKRLREVTDEQLNSFEILPDGYGISWPKLNEDISVKAFVEGLN